MRTVISDKHPLESLCPVNFDAELYDGFPIATRDCEGWTELFNGYIDSLFNNGKIPQS